MKLTAANARREVLRIFEVYAARGPGTNTGAKNAADRAWVKLAPFLLPENRAALVAARALAHRGSGCDSFDILIARLRPEFQAYAAGAAPAEPEPT